MMVASWYYVGFDDGWVGWVGGWLASPIWGE